MKRERGVSHLAILGLLAGGLLSSRWSKIFIWTSPEHNSTNQQAAQPTAHTTSLLLAAAAAVAALGRCADWSLLLLLLLCCCCRWLRLAVAVTLLVFGRVRRRVRCE
jgi:lysylphosphatidylglycerol synthetase-like protein (DUF2156 family)